MRVSVKEGTGGGYWLDGQESNDMVVLQLRLKKAPRAEEARRHVRIQCQCQCHAGCEQGLQGTRQRGLGSERLPYSE